MIAGASGVVAASLLIVYFRLADGQHTVSLQPTAMRHTLVMVRNLYPGATAGVERASGLSARPSRGGSHPA
jgi:hypothetical protein